MASHAERIAAIQQQLATAAADAALLTHLPDIRWAVGFTGSNALLIVRPDTVHFLTDGRYDVQARQEVEGAEIHVPGYELARHAREAGLLDGTAQVLFQGDHVTVSTLADWQQHWPEVAFVPQKAWLVEAVASKSEAEIEKIRQAQGVTDAVFSELLPLLAPGAREHEIAAEIVYQHLRRGCERMAFEPIVASGARSALPHARASRKALEAGDLVLLDMGGVVDGYASDMTRTVAIGEPGAEARRVYQIVLDAQQAALDVAAAGKMGNDLDQAARQIISNAGYGAYFSHSLGHGIGLETHEWPRLSSQVEHMLPERAAVTIEPGIYLPARFGVRIEDLIVLRGAGHENLTTSPKELLVL